ncbi:DUF4138 domain-containing protein [Croceitalea marina]|uniref:DUF4138 domain-containing protein n=1 Tax=Croceitalea marina TaxID=1775166 RepID=A0ABW5MS85_9FLAO
MKKILLFSVLLGTHTAILAQGQFLDTLYANAHQVLSLSFESPIDKGITGSEHFTFGFNREIAENLGLLQAQKGRESNLLVRTLDGNLYGFILAYRDTLSELHHFISTDQQIKKPLQKDGTGTLEKDTIRIPPDPKPDYAQNCQKLLERQGSFHHIKRQKGLRIRMAESLYHGDKVYVVYELKNRSAIPYELGQLQLLKVLGTQKRKASYQELPISPLYFHQMPKVIGSGAKLRFVVVYPKFTLNAEERLQLKVLETHGSRNLTVKLP